MGQLGGVSITIVVFVILKESKKEERRYNTFSIYSYIGPAQWPKTLSQRP